MLNDGSISPMLTVVVDEKEKRIKESMKMVGLRDSVFWLAWFIVYAVLTSITSIVGETKITQEQSRYILFFSF